MTETEKLLAQLKDIHPPAAPESVVSWTWWLTICIALVSITLLALWFKRANACEHTALNYVGTQCKLACEEPVDQGRLRIARLLRQYVLSVDHTTTPHAHQLHGEAWLQHLNTTLETDWFTEGRGRQFGDNLYQRQDQTLTVEDCEYINRLLNRSSQS